MTNEAEAGVVFRTSEAKAFDRARFAGNHMRD